MERLKLIPPEEPSPRIDTSLSVRAAGASLSQDARRIADALGRHWSTEVGEAEAEELGIRVAETALELRRLIFAARRARG